MTFETFEAVLEFLRDPNAIRRGSDEDFYQAILSLAEQVEANRLAIKRLELSLKMRDICDIGREVA